MYGSGIRDVVMVLEKIEDLKRKHAVDLAALAAGADITYNAASLEALEEVKRFILGDMAYQDQCRHPYATSEKADSPEFCAECFKPWDPSMETLDSIFKTKEII